MKITTVIASAALLALLPLGPAVAQNEDDPCSPPGVLVAEDPAGDSVDGNGDADVQSLHIAEPPGATHQLVFTLQLGAASLPSAPPNSQWLIVWNRQEPNADFDRFYVGMTSDATGAVSFEYGDFGVPTGAGTTSPNTNRPIKVGDADSGSYDPATGAVTIALAAAKADNAQPGQFLGGVNVRTFLGHPGAAPKPQAAANDVTADGEYSVVGNESCESEEKLLGIAVGAAFPSSLLALLGLALLGARRRAMHR